jgi:hypothetical protein
MTVAGIIKLRSQLRPENTDLALLGSQITIVKYDRKLCSKLKSDL